MLSVLDMCWNNGADDATDGSVRATVSRGTFGETGKAHQALAAIPTQPVTEISRETNPTERSVCSELFLAVRYCAPRVSGCARLSELGTV